MSGVGEIASVAGIISLAGQSVQVASSLYSFIEAYKQIVPEAERLLDEIERLRKIISDIVVVADAHLQTANSGGSLVQRLQDAISRCSRTMSETELSLKEVSECSNGRRKNRIKAAAQKGYFTDLSRRISTEKETLDVESGTRRAVNNALDQLGAAQCQPGQRTTTQYQEIFAALQDSTSQAAQSADKISERLNVFANGFERSEYAVDYRLREMDARLAAMHSQLSKSLNGKQAKSGDSYRTHFQGSRQRSSARHRVSRKAALTELIGLSCCPQKRSPSAVERYFRVIRPALVSQISCGEERLALWPLEDTGFCDIPPEQRKDMIRTLVELRLLIWLLGQERRVLWRLSDSSNIPNCFLVRAGQLHYRWELSCVTDPLCLRNLLVSETCPVYNWSAGNLEQKDLDTKQILASTETGAFIEKIESELINARRASNPTVSERSLLAFRTFYRVLRLLMLCRSQVLPDQIQDIEFELHMNNQIALRTQQHRPNDSVLSLRPMQDKAKEGRLTLLLKLTRNV
ncbi:MAG: hypothetical protein Q9227_003468 [Pyrenula ochraceoflavens]